MRIANKPEKTAFSVQLQTVFYKKRSLKGSFFNKGKQPNRYTSLKLKCQEQENHEQEVCSFTLEAGQEKAKLESEPGLSQRKQNLLDSQDTKSA